MGVKESLHVAPPRQCMCYSLTISLRMRKIWGWNHSDLELSISLSDLLMNFYLSAETVLVSLSYLGFELAFHAMVVLLHMVPFYLFIHYV